MRSPTKLQVVNPSNEGAPQNYRLMKLKIFFTIALAAAALMPMAAQTKSSARQAHREAHRAQLANNTQRLDRSILDEIVTNDIASREKTAVADNPIVADLLAEAHRHIGKPYVHGAKGPRAFDCSGFTSYVYRQFGHSISPSSRTQYTQGSTVDRKNLKKGDLVFFTSRNSGRNVGHVGIVVTADNETGKFTFIHASIRGVKVSKSDEPYYSRRYVGARRILSTPNAD